MTNIVVYNTRARSTTHKLKYYVLCQRPENCAKAVFNEKKK